MRNLLVAGAGRLKKDRIFWLGMAFMLGLGLFAVWSKWKEKVEYGDAIHLDDCLFIYAVYMGVVMAVLCSLFIGTEYSDGTIRNKIIVGVSRYKIYLSNFLLCFGAAVLMTAFYLIGYLGAGVFVFEPAMAQGRTILFMGALSLATLATYTALFTMISMTVSKKSLSAVICLLVFFGMLMAAMVIDSKLGMPEYITDYKMAADGSLLENGMVPNPRYLGPADRRMYLFLYDLIPTAQGLQISGFAAERPLRIAGLSGAVIVLTTAAGALVFGKKNLK